MLLELRDLSVTYRSGPREVRAVRGVSFDLDAGQTLGVAGESGSGKSTMALSLLRLLPDSAHIAGSVRFKGTELTTARWGELRAVRWAQASVVFQGAMNALNPVQTIGAQIAEPIELHEKLRGRAVRERVDELLDSVGVPAQRRGAYPHELSGGQRQRVMIAMALACRPELIIADEPTTALDVIVQAQILALLTDLVRDAGIGMIMISHDLSVLAETCQRMAVMYAGQLVEIGTSRALIDEPRHPYTRALAGAFPRIGDPASRLAPAGLPGDPPDPADVGVGCPFQPRCPEAFDACPTEPVQLWDAGADRQSACLRVRPEYPDLSTPAPARSWSRSGSAPGGSRRSAADSRPTTAREVIT
jgi:peptide/nickel transport system ATP-binding protein